MPDTDAELRQIVCDLAEWILWNDPSECGDLIECPLCGQLAFRGDSIDHDDDCLIRRAQVAVERMGGHR
jgi:hypothetical protein